MPVASESMLPVGVQKKGVPNAYAGVFDSADVPEPSLTSPAKVATDGSEPIIAPL